MNAALKSLLICSVLLGACAKQVSQENPTRSWGTPPGSVHTLEQACLPYRNNDLRWIATPDVGTGHPARYQLYKMDSKTFVATLNIHFSGADPAVMSALRERTKKCYAAAGPYLKGPNGDSLVFRLAEPDEERPPVAWPVEIVTNAKEDTSVKWRSDISCARILHESLHVFGLVDEYKQEGTPDCRSHGPSESLMTNDARAFSASSPLYMVLKCECEEGSTCDFSHLKGAPDNCPKGSKLAAEFGELEIQMRLERPHLLSRIEEVKDGSVEGNSYVYLRTIPPTRPSMLLPAQFNAIVNPECKSGNSLYYTCAANAYRSSTKQGCIKDLPAECSTEEWLEK